MTADEIKEIAAGVAEILAQQRDEVVTKTVHAVLTEFGVDRDDTKEVKEDFRALRRWRKAEAKVSEFIFRAIVTLVGTAFISAIAGAIVIKEFGKH